MANKKEKVNRVLKPRFAKLLEEISLEELNDDISFILIEKRSNFKKKAPYIYHNNQSRYFTNQELEKDFLIKKSNIIKNRWGDFSEAAQIKIFKLMTDEFLDKVF